MGLSRDQLTHLEGRLLEERDRIVRRLGQHGQELVSATANGTGSPFSAHIADQGTDAMEREKAFLLAGEDGRRLMSVHAALRRLYRDSDGFGICAGCGAEIAWARLEALPDTDVCIECRTKQEIAS